MSKRFTDTNKYKRPFIRGLQGAYKLLWDYLYHDCDHAGIWIVDFEIAQLYIGSDMPVNRLDALKYFNNGEKRIIEIDHGKKWFIPSFIGFQYGFLNEQNRAHNAVINILKKYNLYKNKPLRSSLQGAKDKDKDKDKDIDMVKELDIKEGFGGIFLKWLHYKRKRNESYKDKESCQLAFNKLLKLSEEKIEIAEKVVNQSMAQNWAGLFQCKEDNSGEKKKEEIPVYKIFTKEQMLEKLDKAGGISSFWKDYKEVKIKNLPAKVWIHVNDIAQYNINVET
jgi:hypothetical protein